MNIANYFKLVLREYFERLNNLRGYQLIKIVCEEVNAIIGLPMFQMPS